MDELPAIPKKVSYALAIKDWEDYKFQTMMRVLKTRLIQDPGKRRVPRYEPTTLRPNDPWERCNTCPACKYPDCGCCEQCVTMPRTARNVGPEVSCGGPNKRCYAWATPESRVESEAYNALSVTNPDSLTAIA